MKGGGAPPVGRPRPGDVMSPETLVAALYDTISGPPDQERDWDRFRGLFLPGARLVMGRRWEGPGLEAAGGLGIADVESFIAAAADVYRKDGFWEKEVAGRVDRFGNVAHAWSTYETRIGRPDSEPVARGINSVQMVREAGRWRIAHLAWDVELPDQPIPARYRSRD